VQAGETNLRAHGSGRGYLKPAASRRRGSKRVCLHLPLGSMWFQMESLAMFGRFGRGIGEMRGVRGKGLALERAGGVD
jgi:hypothetical protein